MQIELEKLTVHIEYV